MIDNVESMTGIPDSVDAGLVTRWIERYYEEKLSKKDKRNGAEARTARNPFIAQMIQLN